MKLFKKRCLLRWWLIQTSFTFNNKTIISSYYTSKCSCNSINRSLITSHQFKYNLINIGWITKCPCNHLINYKQDRNSLCSSLLYKMLSLKSRISMYKRRHLFQIEVIISRVKVCSKRCIIIQCRIRFKTKIPKINFSELINNYSDLLSTIHLFQNYYYYYFMSHL